MKRIIFTLITIIVPLFAISQDVIVKMDGNKILAKVLEIGYDEIKYKLFINQDGPLHVIRKSNVYEIIYQNGTSEIINENQDSDNKQEVSDNIDNKHGNKIERYGSHYYQNSRPLSILDVTKILAQNNEIERSGKFRKGYSQKSASIPLLSIGVPILASGVLIGIINFRQNIGRFSLGIGAPIGFILTVAGVSCNIHGKNLINKAINDYNNSATSLNLKHDVKVSFGLSQNSLGLGLYVNF
jgi:hypothetical protein